MNMLNKSLCPYSPKLQGNQFCVKPFYKNIKYVFLTICIFLFILPALYFFYIFHSVLVLTGYYFFLVITLLFIYPYCLRFKFLSTTGVKLPICGILPIFYDIFFRRDLLLRDFDLERKKKFGNIYLTFFGLRPAIIVTSSKLAEQISKDHLRFAKTDPRDLNMPYFYKWVGNNNIVLANGERWQEIRKLIHPPLNEVQIFLPLMVDKINIFCEKINHKLQEASSTPNNSQHFTCSTDKNMPSDPGIAISNCKSKSVEIRLTRWLKALSLDIAGEALFGYNFNHLHEESNPGIAATDYVLNEIFNPIRVSLPIVNRLPIKSNKKLKQSMQLLDNLVNEMIQYYASNNQSQCKNVLSFLLNANIKNTLSTFELRNNILALVLASHETTQVALSAILYFLAKFPHLQAQLREESIVLFPDLSEFQNYVANQNKKTTIYWKLKTFENLENFILESLRLYSPLANQNPRTTMEDVELDGFYIPKGTFVIMNLHAIHMNDIDWSNPEKFDMHRFNKGNNINKYSYLPFGNGPRICSGREFSLIEQKLAVCHILRKFEISLPSHDYVVPIMRYSFTGLPDETFKLCFTTYLGHTSISS